MEIKKITFAYDDKIRRLHHINATVKKGEITTIIGPNGCGKSTLMGVLTKNLLPESGDVVLDGKALQSYKAKELAKKLGVVHQHNIAPSDMTVERLAFYRSEERRVGIDIMILYSVNMFRLLHIYYIITTIHCMHD